MHLSYEQGNLFFDVMDDLLLYVNNRFHIVEELDFDDDDPFLEMKLSLVANFLWDNVEVIDGFVSDTRELDVRMRSIALSWKTPLKDTFTLVRYQDGCALMMNDAAVFRVMGLIDDFDDGSGRTPALVRAVLLPFEDVIVYDGFLSLSDVPFGQERQVQDSFEHLCAMHGIVGSGSDLVEHARKLIDARRDKEADEFFEALTADASGRSVEQLPAGFHRGVLAGVSELKRSELVSANGGTDGFHGTRTTDGRLASFAWEHAPLHAFSDCLSLFPVDKLRESARSLGVPGSASLTGRSLRDAVSRALLETGDDLADALLWCDDVQFETARSLASTPSISFRDSESNAQAALCPLLPYTYLFHYDGSYTLLVPTEVVPFLQSVDFDELTRLRTQYLHAINCTVACVISAGIVPLSEAYEQYERLDDDPLSLESYEQLVSGEASYGDLSFETWEYDHTTYLVHYTLCDDYVAQQVVQQHASVSIPQATVAGRSDDVSYRAVLDDIRLGIGREMDNAQSIRLSLLDAHRSVAMKPIDPVMRERDAYEVLCEYESVRVLRGFLDERVPDGEDDYTFADRAVQGIVATAVEVGDRQALLSYVQEIGLDGCCSDRSRFERMLMRVFDDMPSWEDNGWTAREITERLTGRHVFYDAQGNPMRVGVNDPCPCGSGKKYGDCHGRRG